LTKGPVTKSRIGELIDHGISPRLPESFKEKIRRREECRKSCKKTTKEEEEKEWEGDLIDSRGHVKEKPVFGKPRKEDMDQNSAIWLKRNECKRGRGPKRRHQLMTCQKNEAKKLWESFGSSARAW